MKALGPVKDDGFDFWRGDLGNWACAAVVIAF